MPAGPDQVSKTSMQYSSAMLGMNEMNPVCSFFPGFTESKQPATSLSTYGDRGISKTVEITTIAKPPDYIAVSGDQRYVWFHLVCIPRGGAPRAEPRLRVIEFQEIVKQASVFGQASTAIAWMNAMMLLGPEGMRLIPAVPATGASSYYRPTRQFHAARGWSGTVSGLGTKMCGPLGKPRPVTNLLHLVEGDAMDVVGSERDPHIHVNRWFTLLWALQEARVRPDMWICDQSWEPFRLRHYVKSLYWDDRQNTSLGSIFCFDVGYKCFHLESPSPARLIPAEIVDHAPPSEINLGDGSASRSNSTVVGIAQHRSNMNSSEPFVKERKPSEFPNERSTYNFFNKATIQAEGRTYQKKPNHSLVSNLSKAPLNVKMLDETGMTWFAIVRPRMDMVAIEERRAGKRPKARAYAMLILSQCSVAFFRELRAKIGNADFFGSRTLNRDVPTLETDLCRFEMSASF
ncbi:hypothetical protein CH63R_09562 [Colletotrichum higginsianum IMI 349063]|uniref:Uncharacterized protein n=1 Tax=Colletotrichum higginsianum (strain IMI 349063) TaxID=759273 RepID=A0A1B7Y7L5_COLHI|nr:hypothetical protein CH63R_09562 [Colletotrichum higginsianum IMI 349063]OBR08041.1 hypothetical protein CH63R_09562 [Colletotrichum higginsianum IMI 349063]